MTALHPQVQALVDRLAASGRRPAHLGSVDQARENSARLRALVGPPLPMFRSEDHVVGSGGRAVALRLYVPSKSVVALIVYLHGGGWIMGSLDGTAAAATHLASACRAAVLVVDYPLAPEHRFPRALLDTIDALEWAVAQREQLGLAGVPVVVAGDSAGANLAAAAAAVLAERDGAALAVQVLVCPVLDAACDTPSHREFETGPLVSSAAIRWFWGHYLADPADGLSPRASPLRADGFSRLPPTMILTAAFDPLRDEGERYADRVEAAGVAVVRRRFDGMCHGFFSLVNVLDGATDAMRFVAAELPRLIDAGVRQRT